MQHCVRWLENSASAANSRVLNLNTRTILPKTTPSFPQTVTIDSVDSLPLLRFSFSAVNFNPKQEDLLNCRWGTLNHLCNPFHGKVTASFSLQLRKSPHHSLASNTVIGNFNEAEQRHVKTTGTTFGPRIAHQVCLLFVHYQLPHEPHERATSSNPRKINRHPLLLSFNTNISVPPAYQVQVGPPPTHHITERRRTHLLSPTLDSSGQLRFIPTEHARTPWGGRILFLPSLLHSAEVWSSASRIWKVRECALGCLQGPL